MPKEKPRMAHPLKGAGPSEPYGNPARLSLSAIGPKIRAMTTMQISSPVDAALTVAESERLADLERVVSHGLESFFAVGEALAEIRDRRLYRVTHDTWLGYLSERWELSPNRGYQLMAASEALGAIIDAGGEVPAGLKANAVRELVPLMRSEGPRAVAQAWGDVMETRQGERKAPSAGDVRKVLQATGRPTPPPRGPRSLRLQTIGTALDAAAKAINRVRDDLEGQPLAPKRRDRVAEWAAQARDLSRALDELASGGVLAGRLTDAEARAASGRVFCVGHGRMRDDKGVCRACGVPDIDPRRHVRS